MHTQTSDFKTHSHAQRGRAPAESIDGHTHSHRYKQTDAQLCPFLNNLSSYGSCGEVRRVAEKMFRHLSLTTHAAKKHCYATVGHFVNRRDDSVAVKCQNKWRKTDKGQTRKGRRCGIRTIVAGMDFILNKWM